MSPELTAVLIAVATVGVTLAALMVGLFTWLRQEVGNRFDRLETRLAAVEHGQAKLEGLREAITGRRAAS